MTLPVDAATQDAMHNLRMRIMFDYLRPAGNCHVSEFAWHFFAVVLGRYPVSRPGQVADRLNLNVRTLARRFHFGGVVCGPSEYVRGAALLRLRFRIDAGQSLSAASIDGWSSPQAASRFLRQQFGMGSADLRAIPVAIVEQDYLDRLIEPHAIALATLYGGR